ncbi:MAG: D-sedoheptulose 7-phosphate isomerase [Nitrospirae bacterium]|nr:D-sedoheptulose 7-phosphate isomerase [Nitrospirota bacterium]
MKDKIRKEFNESIDVKERFVQGHLDAVVDLSTAIAAAFNAGNKVLLFGNGGSSTDASHIAAEFVNRFKRERPGLPAIALNTDMAVITSIANDYDFSEIFARQIKSLGVEGDIAIALSTSGQSPNIIKALDAAKRKKLKTVFLTGLRGEKLAAKTTFAFVVPSENTPRIQETHITLGHVICLMVEDILFDQPRKKSL